MNVKKSVKPVFEFSEIRGVRTPEIKCAWAALKRIARWLITDINLVKTAGIVLREEKHLYFIETVVGKGFQ